jgi:hypothetical protein
MLGFVHLVPQKRIQATLLRFVALREEVLEVIDPNSAAHAWAAGGTKTDRDRTRMVRISAA